MYSQPFRRSLKVTKAVAAKQFGQLPTKPKLYVLYRRDHLLIFLGKHFFCFSHEFMLTGAQEMKFSLPPGKTSGKAFSNDNGKILQRFVHQGKNLFTVNNLCGLVALHYIWRRCTQLLHSHETAMQNS